MALEKYTDPGYNTIDLGVEEKLGLPTGLLTAIRTRGERSNADQVSSAKAQTVYQVIPETRDAIIAKYKIDPWLSPENAALGAGYLLKEGLERNRGDAAQAVGEYVGGLDRKNWGAITKSYINRVMTGMKAAAPMAQEQPAQGGRRLSQELAAQQPTQPSIAKIFQAYQSGEMPADVAGEFEADVNAGKVLLPRGMQLKAGATPVQPIPVNAAVMKSYSDGTMPADVRAELEADIKSGRAVIESVASQIPGQTGQPVTAMPTPATPTPSIMDRVTSVATAANPAALAASLITGKFGTPQLDQVRGTVEAGLSAATGMTGGALGLVGGGIGGLAGSIMSGQFGTPEGARNIEQAAAEGAQELTYQPRTAEGQQQAQAVGETLAQTIPVMPLTGEMALAGRAAQAVAPTARVAAETVGQQAVTAAKQIPAVASKVTTLPRRAMEAIGKAPEQAPTPGTKGSMGAAGTDMATQRRMTAESFPVPIELTKGQATRDPAQLKFEVETAKMPAEGTPLRQRTNEQNEAMLSNFDVLIDQTGAKAPTLRATGQAVDSALVKQAARDKNEVNVAYTTANKSAEAKALVDHDLPVQLGEGDSAMMTTPIQFVNDQPIGLPSTALTDAARQYAVKLGIADLVEGQLVPKPATIRQMEAWRKAVNQATGFDPTEIRQATILKALIDGQTEPVAGPLYRQARGLRARMSQNYENRAVISKLLSNKRGTSDRQVAFEDVLDHAIFKGSLDDVRNVRRVLHRSGEEGQQAWRELQGATLNRIKERATARSATDATGNRIVSADGLDKIIRELDTDGRLDFVFGKKGAERLRDLNDLAKYVKTIPPEAGINTSNTAATLLSAFADIAFSMSTGAPAPITLATRMGIKQIKDRKLRARIDEALKPATP